MKSKMTTNEAKKREKQRKQKLSKQLEQEQNHRNGDHMVGYQQGRKEGEWRKRYKGISSVNDR